MFRTIIKFAVVFTFLVCPCVEAHRPVFTNEKGVDSETAVKITNPDVSQVIYRSLTNETPQLWLAFDAKKNFELFVQIGIPVIDRLKNFRPSFVVLGPDLSGDLHAVFNPQRYRGKIFFYRKSEKTTIFP